MTPEIVMAWVSWVRVFKVDVDNLHFLFLIIVSVVLCHRITVAHHTGITLSGGRVNPCWVQGLGWKMVFFHVVFLTLLVCHITSYCGIIINSGKLCSSVHYKLCTHEYEFRGS